MSLHAGSTAQSICFHHNVVRWRDHTRLAYRKWRCLAKSRFEVTKRGKARKRFMRMGVSMSMNYTSMLNHEFHVLKLANMSTSYSTD